MDNTFILDMFLLHKISKDLLSFEKLSHRFFLQEKKSTRILGGSSQLVSG